MTTDQSPTVEDYRSRATDQGFEFELTRYAAALSTHAGMRQALEELRTVPLSFLDPTEPNSALVWIESGGLSSPGGIR